MADDLIIELLKIVFTTSLTLGLGWIIGNRIAVKWAIRQKRKELQLTVASDFEEIYGKFYSIWKVWNYFLRQQIKEHQKVEDIDSYLDILNRACEVNGCVELIILKLTSETVLNEEDLKVLSAFRDSFRILRRNIRDQKEIPWQNSNNPDYLSFKQAASYIAHMIATNDLYKMPSKSEASENFIKISLYKVRSTKSNA